MKEKSQAPVYICRGTGMVTPPHVALVPNPEDARARAVFWFRRLADMLERRELEGARISWRDGWDKPVRVEVDYINNEVRAFDLRDEGK